MIDEKVLVDVVKRMGSFEDVRWALKWVITGKVSDGGTPSIIRRSLGEYDDE